MEGLRAAQEVKRGAAFGAGLSEGEGAGGEVESEERLAAGELGLRRTPVETAGDHEMKDEPEVAGVRGGIEANSDALADAAEGSDGAAFD